MRAVVSRVSGAALTIDGRPGPRMDKGLLVLLGIRAGDGEREASYLAEKIKNLRVFEDENGKMNLSLEDAGGEVMAVSNFTLYADCARGRRPDFFHAAKPEIAIPVYEFFLGELRRLGVGLHHGEFGAEMQINHINDGPVTLILDTEQMMKR